MQAGLLFFILSVLALGVAAKSVKVYDGVTVNKLQVDHPHHKAPHADSFTYPVHGYPPDQVALGITGAIAAMFFNPLMMGLAGAILSDSAFEKDENKLDGTNGKVMYFLTNATFGGLYWGLKYIVLMWGNPWMAMMWSSICNVFWLSSIIFCLAMVQPRKVWAPITVLGGFVLNGITTIIWIVFILHPPEW